ncbi:hypothetical protein BVI434_530005 [Burkholderia vietnamiensis]|nr:hypothetical protein BVI434_530005 [Burkholderia vietnamiensis]
MGELHAAAGELLRRLFERRLGKPVGHRRDLRLSGLVVVTPERGDGFD